MKPSVPRNLFASAAVLLALGSVGVAGCADNRSSLYIVGVLAPPTGTECGVTYDAGQGRIGRGTMDKVLTSSYSPQVLIGNQLVPQGNNDQLRLETSRVDLLGAEVSLSRAGGGQVASFTTNVSGSINPAPSANPGYGGAEVTMIPSGLDPEPGEYLATVRVFGRTLGGRELETGDFNFPIIVCEGCLISGFNAAGECLPPTGNPELPCTPGEDASVHCILLE